MSYKRFVITGVAVVLSSVLMLSACSKKKSEEEITITLKTEGTVSPQSVTTDTSTSTRPSVPLKQEAVHDRKGRVKKTEQAMVQPLQGQTAPENKTPGMQTQVASNAPPVVQQPSPEDIARQQILAIINRQKQAMAAKNVNLALEDLAGNHDQNEQALQDYFDRYEKISVDFSNISVNVSGGTAIAVMDQRTSIVTKSVIPQTVTELTKVQWTFVDENGKWFITGTQILSKMKGK